MLAAQGIATGDIDIAVAGGMESMSNCPYLLPRVREGLRMGNGDDRRLDDPRRPVVRVRAVPHGHVRRRRRRAVHGRRAPTQDEYAADSHRRRRTPRDEGWFKDEILPDRDSAEERAPPIVVDRDEAIREDTTAEALAALKPAFKKDGTVTAGNAPGVNDGAAAARRDGGRARAARSA